jgi:hypothetical protein
MTLSFDEDIILPILITIIAIPFVYCNQSCMLISTHEQVLEQSLSMDNQARVEASASFREVDALTKELESYRATAETLQSLGASQQQAKDTIKAAETYNLDPKS